MNVVPYGSLDADLVDAWLRTHSDGWFWHSPRYMAYARAFMAEQLVADESFIVLRNGEIRAVAPLLVERGKEGRSDFLAAGYPQAMPALPLAGKSEDRLRIARACHDEVVRIGRERGIDSISYQSPPGVAAAPALALPLGSYLAPLGFEQQSVYTQVLAFPGPVPLRSDLRKGHRAAIQAAERDGVSVDVLDKRTCNDAAVDAYRRLHERDAGRATRSPETFDLMHDWVKAGDALLLRAVQEGVAVAFSLFITYGVSAYYASSCRDVKAAHAGTQHLIQWRFIEGAQERGIRRYELGLQPYGEPYGPPWTSKQDAIARFKRGFGGRVYPCPIWSTGIG